MHNICGEGLLCVVVPQVNNMHMDTLLASSWEAIAARSSLIWTFLPTEKVNCRPRYSYNLQYNCSRVVSNRGYSLFQFPVFEFSSYIWCYSCMLDTQLGRHISPVCPLAYLSPVIWLRVHPYWIFEGGLSSQVQLQSSSLQPWWLVLPIPVVCIPFFLGLVLRLHARQITRLLGSSAPMHLCLANN